MAKKMAKILIQNGGQCGSMKLGRDVRTKNYYVIKKINFPTFFLMEININETE